MDKITPERKFTIRFSGRIAEQHKVPALVLNDALVNLQRAIHLLAMQHDNIDARQKDRVTKEIQETYVLLCDIPEPGSYNMPISLGHLGDKLFSAPNIDAVANNFERFCQAIQSKDEAVIKEIMPEPKRRRNLLDAIKKISPRRGSGIHVQISRNDRSFFVSQKLQSALSEISLSHYAADEVHTVTGKLIKIDFEERKVTIHYAPTNRMMECFYEPSVEEMLLNRPRELIQVTGIIRLDENGLPIKIVNVEEIKELDLQAIYCDEVRNNNTILKFFKPLLLEPKLVEENQLLLIQDDTIGIDIVASTIEEIEELLYEEIVFLWQNYALADDKTLSPNALKLKYELQKRIQEEVNNG